VQNTTARVFSITGFFILAAMAHTVAKPAKLYVSPVGNDAWSGAKRTRVLGHFGTNGPFATLERARDEIRERRKAGALSGEGVEVELQAGTYVLTSTFELSEADSGTTGSPVVYRAREGRTVRLVGGMRVPPLQPVTDQAILKILPPKAHGHVLTTDLTSLGIEEFGSPNPTAQGCEVFWDHTPMTLARWPNHDFTRVKGVAEKEVDVCRGTMGSRVGRVVYDDDHVARWKDEPDGWVNGFWFWDWAEQAHPIASINADTKTLEVAKPYHRYGYRKRQWFYGFNLLCELDAPGEYYIDREAGKLYAWPPEGQSADEAVFLSSLKHVVTMTDASHITLHGLTIEACRGTAVVIKGGTGSRIEACTLRNTGNRAVTVTGGANHTVFGCDISETANGSVTLTGGDRKTLTRSDHVLENCWIRRYGRLKRTFCTSVSLQGVGQTARRNLIHDAPYIAIWFGGNDHIIELNEIHSVCLEANDSGAIYAGRAWDKRGTSIRHNYVHDVVGFEGRGCNGIYLDDMFSGTEVTGNIVVRVPRAFLIGGGRDNLLTNNVIVDCKYGMHIDNRGLGWAKASVPGSMTKQLRAMPYENELWRRRYPALAGTLDDEPGSPKGNIVDRNISVNSQFDRMCAQAEEFGHIGRNLIGEDPLFVDANNNDYRLRPESPALKLGFQPIPTDRIGVYRHPLRATWPVRHAVRLPEGVDQPHSPSLPPKEAVAQGPKPLFKAGRQNTTIAIDGTIKPGEWKTGGSRKAFAIEQKLDRSKVTPPSRAWICWDNDALYVAVDTDTASKTPLKQEAKWGSSDAVEVAIQNPSKGKRAPILVLRGYPCGTFESSGEAGAPKADVAKAGKDVQFAVQVAGAGRWTTEWRIPFASLGIDPTTTKKINFNLTSRQSARRLWLLLVGPLDLATWDVRNGAILELVD
jgi:hypothetical protein